jgi:DNA-binding transcriptional LysR family regulator
MLDLHKLMIFRCVATFGSFSKAAQELSMTQSAVSQHIQDLERALGVILFQRMSRGAQPTEAGLRLCDHTDELFRVVAKIEHDLVDIRDTAQRHLTISAAPGVAEYVLPGWIAAFQRRFSNIKCLLRTAEPSEALLDLDRRRSDICLVEGLSRVTSEAHNCEWRNVGASDMHLVFGREGGLFSAHSSSLSAGERLPIACYEAGSDLRQRTERALRQSAVAWTVGAEFASIEALLRITQSSALCAVVARDWAAPQRGPRPHGVESSAVAGIDDRNGYGPTRGPAALTCRARILRLCQRAHRRHRWPGAR